MTLKETIAADLTKAMKSGEKLRLETLRTVRAALMEKEIERRGSGRDVSSEDELAVLSTAAKKRRESIDQFRKGGRLDLVEQEEAELAIIQEYLPKQLSNDEIEAVVSKLIASTGASSSADFGKVMPAVMKEVKGRADGRAVQEIVKRALGA